MSIWLYVFQIRVNTRIRQETKMEFTTITILLMLLLATIRPPLENLNLSLKKQKMVSVTTINSLIALDWGESQFSILSGTLKDKFNRHQSIMLIMRLKKSLHKILGNPHAIPITFSSLDGTDPLLFSQSIKMEIVLIVLLQQKN